MHNAWLTLGACLIYAQFLFENVENVENNNKKTEKLVI